jgi:hypothetical protein
LIKHIGNRLDAIDEVVDDLGMPGAKKQGRRLLDIPLIKKPLLKIYEAIFKAYFG